MRARTHSPTRQATRLSSVLLVVALSPAMLQTSDCNSGGNPALASLELRAGGVDRVVDFDSGTRVYDVWLDGATTMTMVANPVEGSATVRWTYGGTSDVMDPGLGASELVVTPGVPSLRVTVVTRGGASRLYELRLDAECEGWGQCDDANPCTYDTCGVEDAVCEFEPESQFDFYPCVSVDVGDGACDGGLCAPSTFAWAQSIDSPDDGYSTDPRVAIDADGRGLAAWRKGQGIWASRFTPELGWEAAVRIEPAGVGSTYFEDLVTNGEGDGFAMWNNTDQDTAAIWTSRFTPSTGWSAAERIYHSESGGGQPHGRLAIDDAGNALAVWAASDDALGVWQFWTSRYTVGEGWGTATLLQPTADPAAIAGEVDVAVAADGHGVAVWSQRDPSSIHGASGAWNIWASRYDPSTGWELPVRVEEEGRPDTFGPQVAVDANGGAIAVWYEADDGTGDGVWANRYAADSGWGMPHRFDTPGGTRPSRIRLALAGDGRAMALWEQSQGLQTSRYTPGAGWGPTVSPDSRGQGGNVGTLAIDADGRVIAVWQGFDRLFYPRAYVNRYTPASGWGFNEPLGGGGNFGVDLAMNESGQALAVFARQSSQGSSILASDSLTPP